MKFTLLLFALFFFGCQSNSPSNSNATNEKVDTSASSSNVPAKTNAKTGNINVSLDGNIFQKNLIAGKIKYSISAENKETSIIHIKSEGLQVREYEQDITVEGQLINAYALDLNHDEFYEVYLIVEGNDGNGQLEIKGIASYNDKSAGEIYVKDIQVKRKPQTDKVYVHYGNLTRQFNDETNHVQVYQYKLNKGEAGFILEPSRTQ
ncbi:MAG: hypothetical protein R2825_19885 [Saprospiraceae bacterium]